MGDVEQLATSVMDGLHRDAGRQYLLFLGMSLEEVNLYSDESLRTIGEAIGRMRVKNCPCEECGQPLPQNA